MDIPLMPHLFLIIVIFLIVFFFAFVILWKGRKGSGFSNREKEFFKNEWQKVETLKEMSPTHAVLEADKIFDNVLKKMGYRGGFADKFKKAQKLVGNKEEIWKAHKLRNRIAHESGFEINSNQAHQSISAFRSGLSYLGIRV